MDGNLKTSSHLLVTLTGRYMLGRAAGNVTRRAVPCVALCCKAVLPTVFMFNISNVKPTKKFYILRMF